jgi:hypothetical protein
MRKAAGGNSEMILVDAHCLSAYNLLTWFFSNMPHLDLEFTSKHGDPAAQGPWVGHEIVPLEVLLSLQVF